MKWKNVFKNTKIQSTILRPIKLPRLIDWLIFIQEYLIHIKYCISDFKKIESKMKTTKKTKQNELGL